MSPHRVTVAMIGVSMMIVCGQWSRQAAAQVNVDVGGVHVHVGDDSPPPPPPAQEVVVLTRGPIHEAFAQPVVLDEEAEFVIPHRPPAPIVEIIPDEKPEGNHVVWIPGYWSWDSDASDFVWVTGCWRAVPPGTGWVPGYWAPCEGGYQWIAGFWTTADADEIDYLPAPPASLEEGPQGAGAPTSIWIPGCWIRHEGGYAWRPGFWEEGRPKWVWEPAHYVFTPRGWVFVDGYWDYPLSRRGVAFLPLHCPSDLYRRGAFRYAPEYAVDLEGLTLNLFISPQRHHYYFGDYYGPEYVHEGFHPWYEARDHHEWYDPIYVHRQWVHHDDHQWAQHQRDEYEHRRNDRDLRPARTYEAMRTHVAGLPEKDRRDAQVARPMRDIVAEKSTPFKFETIDAKHRAETGSREKDVQAFRDKESQWESPAVFKAEADHKEGARPGDFAPSKEPAHAKELPKQDAKGAAPEHVMKLDHGDQAQKLDHGDAIKGQPGGPADKFQKSEHGDQPQKSDHGDAAKGQPFSQDLQAQKVKIPKTPIAVREPVQGWGMAPPSKPKQPNLDLNAREKHVKEAPAAQDRSKDNEDKDKDTDKDRHDPGRK